MDHQHTRITAASLDVDLGRIFTAIGQPHRASILLALLDGRPHTAADLAATIGVPPSAATGHLHRLVEADLVVVRRSGRFRLHRIVDPAVANLVEALVALAPPAPITSLSRSTAARAHREARTCYDHVAGKLGVRLTEGLANAGAVGYHPPSPAERAGSITTPVTLGPRAEGVFATLGIDITSVTAASGRRPPLRLCIDWSERRPHLAGAVGAALLTSLLEHRWVRRRTARALQVTPGGSKHLAALLAEQPPRSVDDSLEQQPTNRSAPTGDRLRSH